MAFTMTNELYFDYFMFGLIIFYILYVMNYAKEPFSENYTEHYNDTLDKECSDKALSSSIFDYVSSPLNQTKV